VGALRAKATSGVHVVHPTKGYASSKPDSALATNHFLFRRWPRDRSAQSRRFRTLSRVSRDSQPLAKRFTSPRQRCGRVRVWSAAAAEAAGTIWVIALEKQDRDPEDTRIRSDRMKRQLTVPRYVEWSRQWRLQRSSRQGTVTIGRDFSGALAKGRTSSGVQG